MHLVGCSKPFLVCCFAVDRMFWVVQWRCYAFKMWIANVSRVFLFVTRVLLCICMDFLVSLVCCYRFDKVFFFVCIAMFWAVAYWPRSKGLTPKSAGSPLFYLFLLSFLLLLLFIYDVGHNYDFFFFFSETNATMVHFCKENHLLFCDVERCMEDQYE